MSKWKTTTLSLILASPLSAAQMVVFGDSLSDGGYYLGTRLVESSGLLWHEYLADQLGFDPARTGFLGTTGNNLAVSASRVSDLSAQVNRYSTRYTWQSGDLCTLWIGGNDLRDDPTQDMSALATEIGDIIAQLAALGVDHIIVPNLPDMGAIPESLQTPMASARTAGSLAFNSALANELDDRAEDLGITIEQLDVFGLFDQMLSYSADYGFTNVTDPLNSSTNGNAEEYAFYDSIHPTSRSHYLIQAASLPLLDPDSPISIVSWSIGANQRLRQTWLADPSSSYQILTGSDLNTLSPIQSYTSQPAYTVEIEAPGSNSGFYQTRKNQ